MIKSRVNEIMAEKDPKRQLALSRKLRAVFLAQVKCPDHNDVNNSVHLLGLGKSQAFQGEHEQQTGDGPEFFPFLRS